MHASRADAHQHTGGTCSAHRESVAGAHVGLACAHRARGGAADQAKVAVSKGERVVAGLGGFAVLADVLARHDGEALVHAHPNLRPGADVAGSAGEACAGGRWPHLSDAGHTGAACPAGLG